MSRPALRPLTALPLLLIVLACGDGRSGAEETPPSEAPGDAATAEPAAPGGGPVEVSPEDREAILGTGLLGEWRWVGFEGMDDSAVEVDDPSRYTLFFRVDGVAVQADCNRGRGSYDLEGSGLTLGPIATTLMACPGESLADRYFRNLADVRSWTIRDGHLFLSLMADAGIMEFEPGEGPAE